jgi:hypothetical protein
VQAGAFVVGGVEPEVARKRVVDAILAVAAGIEVAVRRTARVVLVGGPDGVEERDEQSPTPIRPQSGSFISSR